MRLIDADWILANLKLYTPSDERWGVVTGTALRFIHNAIDNAPTVDTVPVVRYKNCYYFRLNDENVPYCSNRFGLNDPETNGFCNYGV